MARKYPHRISVDISEEVFKTISTLAASRTVSHAAVVRWAIDAYIAAHVLLPNNPTSETISTEENEAALATANS